MSALLNSPEFHMTVTAAGRLDLDALPPHAASTDPAANPAATVPAERMNCPRVSRRLATGWPFTDLTSAGEPDRGLPSPSPTIQSGSPWCDPGRCRRAPVPASRPLSHGAGIVRTAALRTDALRMRDR